MSDEHLLLYQRFSLKLSSHSALTFLLSVFEVSVLALFTLLLVFLIGTHSNYSFSVEAIPSYSPFVILALYPFFKTLLLLYLIHKSIKQQLVINITFQYNFLYSYSIDS
jgi:hypothetical protein